MQLSTKKSKWFPELCLQVGGIFLVIAEVTGGGLSVGLTENEKSVIVEAVDKRIQELKTNE